MVRDTSCKVNIRGSEGSINSSKDFANVFPIIAPDIRETYKT